MSNRTLARTPPLLDQLNAFMREHPLYHPILGQFCRGSDGRLTWSGRTRRQTPRDEAFMQIGLDFFRRPA